MKRPTFFSTSSGCTLLAIGLLSLPGCSRETSVQHKPPAGKVSNAKVPTPEVLVTKFETSEDRAQYLRGLAKDQQFEPQKHEAMLRKYTTDSDQNVAAAAQELLDRK